MPAFYIVLQEKIAGVNGISLEGRALSTHSDRVQKLAEDAGVRPLTSFISIDRSEAEGLLGEDFADTRLKIPEKQWFSPEDGLRTISALLAAPELQTIPDAAKLVGELNQFKDVLEAARRGKVRWHLSIDY